MRYRRWEWWGLEAVAIGIAMVLLVLAYTSSRLFGWP
jgi:hypothetical protein